MVMRLYLPKEMLPDDMDDMSFEEFFELYAKADVARELKIDEIRAAIVGGIADIKDGIE